jgi:phage/plasmid primase-like uncharacterized protein
LEILPITQYQTFIWRTINIVNAENIIAILGGDLKTGKCNCPAHDDRNPSLSVKAGDNGVVLVKCWAGCTQEAVISSLKERGAWGSNKNEQLSPAELKYRRDATEKRKAERLKIERAKQTAAQLKTVEILKRATGNPAQHEYALNKGGLSFGTRIKRGRWLQRDWLDALLIPLYDTNQNIATISAINTNGEKDLLKGGKKTGCFYPIGNITNTEGLLVIGEGLATVAAVCKVMECPGVVAIDAGNLIPVARNIRKLALSANIVIIADDDQKYGGRGE